METKEVKITLPVKEKTITEKFLEELDEKEREIFLKIKDTRISVCDYEEFEAVTEDSLDDYAFLITYAKQGKITFENDGVILHIRRPLKSEKGEIMTDKIKLLFNRNEARERAFTKKIKLKQGDTSASMDYTRAVVAANLDNITFNGVSVIIGPNNIAGNKMHQNDYRLLMTLFEFFRN